MNNLSKNKQGFTLVELMIGMVLSLILLAAVAIIYLSSSQTNRTSQGLLNAQSDVQYALNFLKEDIARTGWVNNNSAQGYSLSTPLPADYANYDGGSGSDTIKLHFESCDSSDTDNQCISSGIDSEDCAGVSVTAGDIITNSYTVNSNKVLTCNSQPLISNVESFQVLYGQVTDAGIQYVTANNISDVSKIHSIRFGLIVSSGNDTGENNINRSIDLLDKTITSNDKKIRLKYESTVVVLNKPFTSNFGI